MTPESRKTDLLAETVLGATASGMQQISYPECGTTPYNIPNATKA